MENIIFERKEKPPILFIGTQTADIKKFEPRKGNIRSTDEGPVIFATPDKALASIFTIENHNDSWTKIGYYNDILVIVICMDREKFIKNDKGGLIYSVSSDSFDYDPNLGMGDKEWTSTTPTKPISENKVSSSLESMLENGVQVYFVNPKDFKKITELESEWGDLDTLVNLKSENELRNKNFKTLKTLAYFNEQ